MDATEKQANPISMDTIGKQAELELQSATRNLSNFPLHLVRAGALGLSFWLLYVMFVSPVDTLVIRAAFTSVIAAMGFLLWPVTLAHKGEIVIPWYDWFLAALSCAVLVYLLVEFRGIIFRTGVSPTTLDIVFGSVVILLIIELARRTTGWSLPILCAIFLLYTLYGGYLPGVLGHPGYSFSRTVSFLYGVQGLYNIPLGVISTFVVMFVFFGTLLQHSGGGEAIIELAKSIAGGTRGGPAKVSIIASALFGSISGSAVANVVVTGTFTIPMMKKAGYPGYFAASVEAVASTGGQITPPVLGAAAFLLAEMLGRPYTDVVIASIIPAGLFYVSLFFMVDFEAAKRRLFGLPKDQLPKLRSVLKKEGILLTPILFLIFFLLAMKLSPLRSALWACVSVVLISLAVSLAKQVKFIGLKGILESLISTQQSLINVTATAAAAGIIIGTMSLSGLGHRLAIMLISYSDGNVLIALILTMIIALILGAGLPPVAAYAIAGTAVGPALIQMGLAPMAAHLFIFYFSAISVITPPVALAAFTAAALAGEDMWKVGMTAFRIGIASYIVPYMFVYEPSLLMVGFSPLTFVHIATGAVGLCMLSGAVQGWLGKNIQMWLRCLLGAAALMLVKPGIYTDITGLLIGAFAFMAIRKGFGVLPDQPRNL